MYQLRDYQREAVNRVLRFFRKRREPILVVLPTGAGKSLVIAELARLAKGRVLVLAHVKELVEQNHQKYSSYGLSAGIYSAGLGKKDWDGKAIFGSVQSIARAPDAFFEDFSLLVSVMVIFARLFRRIFSRGRPVSRIICLPRAAPSDLHCAEVLVVYDGDTVDVLRAGQRMRIRLSGIDAPEDGQPWAGNAKGGLIKLIGGRFVYLEVIELDVYGRTVATLFVENHGALVNVNERMVAHGHAWVYRRYYRNLSRARQEQLDRHEISAKSKRAGLWREENPIPPWEWREAA